MKKIIEYDVVSNCYLQNITEELNKKINEGWQPFGDLITYRDQHSGGWYYSQPIVKYEENSDLILSEKIVSDWIDKHLNKNKKEQLNG